MIDISVKNLTKFFVIGENLLEDQLKIAAFTLLPRDSGSVVPGMDGA